MNYKYKGLYKDGKIIKGNIVADNKKKAIKELNEKNIYNIIYIKQNKVNFIKKKNQIKDKDIIFFTKRLEIMLASGININKALNIISTTNINLQDLILNILDGINQGKNFSEVLSNFPKYFDKIYISLIKIGEETGHLDKALKDILYLKEQKKKLNNKIKTAMIYPNIIFIVLGIFILIGCFYFVPTFEELFKNQEISLPLITEIVFGLIKISPIIILFILFFVKVMKYFIKNNNNFQNYVKRIYDKLFLKIPFIKNIIRNFYCYNFCFTLNLMLTNGLRLNESLEILKNENNNTYIKKEIENILELMNNGFCFSDAIKNQISNIGIFDELFYSIIVVGEESGKLNKSLEELFNFFNNEFNVGIDILIEYVQPFMIIFIAILILPVILAIYLPILDVSSGSFLNL